MPWQNLITDVAGVRVGHAHDARLGSGVTAVVFDEPAIASVDIRGGGPATRQGDLLAPGRAVERVDAFALSGGSAFGIEAGGGVQALLREQGRGFAVGPARVPIVPGGAGRHHRRSQRRHWLSLRNNGRWYHGRGTRRG